jgi:hypothetical protein
VALAPRKCLKFSLSVVSRAKVGLAGDYLFGLKGNQSGVLERAERLLAQEAFPP